jgi:phytoene synthase
VSVGHYENFPVASVLLPEPLRAPIAAIYRFARSADDIADEGNAPAEQRLDRLARYAAHLQAIGRGAEPDEPPFRDLARVVRAHALPLEPFRDLLDAFRQDVLKTRYADFGELLDYCRRSANPVGRLLLHLFGRNDAAALRQSDAICSSLQLVNFWQDVALDWRKDRLYLPLDEMRRFGVGEQHLREQRCDEAWRALMAFQCDRARAMMLAGAPLAGTLRGRLALEIALTVQGGLRILEKLRAVGYDSFRRRPVLGRLDWPVLLWRAL